MRKRANRKQVAWVLIVLVFSMLSVFPRAERTFAEAIIRPIDPEFQTPVEAIPERECAPASDPTPCEPSVPVPDAAPEPVPVVVPVPPLDPAPKPIPEPEAVPEPMPIPSTIPAPTPTASHDSDDMPVESGDGGLQSGKAKPRLELDLMGVVIAGEGGMPIPQIYQYDYKTVLCKYDGIPRSVSTSGCNVTCVSMVTAYLKGNYDQSPESMFLWSLKQGLYHGNGLGHAQMSRVAQQYGVESRWIQRDGAAVIQALNDGYPVIAHMGPGLFTRNGHYIVLRGVTEDGKILVNDPASATRSKYAYPISAIVREAKGSNPFMICKAGAGGGKANPAYASDPEDDGQIPAARAVKAPTPQPEADACSEKPAEDLTED